MNDNEQILNRKELAGKLKVHPRTIDNYMKMGMPYLRLSPRAVRFRICDVVEWMRKQAQRD